LVLSAPAEFPDKMAQCNREQNGNNRHSMISFAVAGYASDVSHMTTILSKAG
jgi:hypothetical protein